VRSLLLLATCMALGFAFVASCGTTQADSTSCEEGEFAGPDGSCVPRGKPYCQPCSGNIASALPAYDCPAQQCPSKGAFAVCQDSCWSNCACSIPPGYELVDAGFFGSEAGDAETGPTEEAAIESGGDV
jgi:hypothetical protein